MRLAVPDLISPSYFPAMYAVEAGHARSRGLEVSLELRFPVTDAVAALRSGEIDFLAGAAHTILSGAPDGGGLCFLGALAQHTYWFLVVRSDVGISRGDDLARLAGLRVGAAPGPVDALVQLLLDAGVEPASVAIGPVPGSSAGGVSFGVTAAEALAGGAIDAFWANGMGAEVAVRRGKGAVVIDARRGDGPPGVAAYTFPALMARRQLVEEQPEAAAAMLGALVAAQRELRDHPARATGIGERLFPPMEAGLIAELIRRDAPYYLPAITSAELEPMLAFAQARGISEQVLGVDELVWSGAEAIWSAAPEGVRAP